jgi:hypothetical protein
MFVLSVAIVIILLQIVVNVNVNTVILNKKIPINERIENHVSNALIAVTPIMLLPFVENALGRKKKNHPAILLLRILLLVTNRVPIRTQTNFGVATVFSQQNVHLYRNNQLELVGVRQINNLYLMEFVADPYLSLPL